MNVEVNTKEYEKLIRRLEFFDTMRNNLLTFSFTSVLTVLGVALALDMTSVGACLCLIPFFLIIPFAARIAYYRLASAHINSFLRMFAKDSMQFEIGTSTVTEDNCMFYKNIAWLINHEMFLLSIATSVTFYLKFAVSLDNWTHWYIIELIIPILSSAIVYLLSHSTYSYKKLMEGFEDRWESYIEDPHT